MPTRVERKTSKTRGGDGHAQPGRACDDSVARESRGAALRPDARAELLSVGALELSDAELLTALLGRGSPDGDSSQLGLRLLEQFRGLRGVALAPTAELRGVAGVGPATCAMLKAAFELGRRSLMENLDRDMPLESSEQAETYVLSRLAHRDREVFACLFLDTRHRVIRFDELFLGTIDGAVVYPREVVRRSLLCNAAAAIAVHNHPSGIAEPSTADIALTGRLRDALRLVDVRLLDHLVVGYDEVVSLSRRGLI